MNADASDDTRPNDEAAENKLGLFGHWWPHLPGRDCAEVSKVPVHLAGLLDRLFEL